MACSRVNFTFYHYVAFYITDGQTHNAICRHRLPNSKHFCIVIREYICCGTTPLTPTLITLTGYYCNRNAVIPVCQELTRMSSLQSTKERIMSRSSLSVRPYVQATFIKDAFGTFMKFNLELITHLHINFLMVLRKLDFITRQ